MQVESVGQEGPLEKEMATHASIFPWKSYGRGAWLAIVRGIAKSQKWLSNEKII